MSAHPVGGTPAVSVVLVAHRSAAVLPTAIRAYRREAADAAVALEIVVVEHSEDAEEAATAETWADRVLRRPNRGYAAGVNTGVAAATGTTLIAANPDVELERGALPELLGTLEGGTSVVGPRFELEGFVFPLPDPQRPLAELRRRLALRSARRWQRQLAREAAASLPLWTAAGRTVAASSLSGAALAFRRDLVSRVGEWDEAFFLYFEETEWLDRVRANGGELAVAPGAAARHAWGHATRRGDAAAAFAASRSRYYRRRFGPLGAAVLRVPEAPPPERPLRWPGSVSLPAAELGEVFVSPSGRGFPMARYERSTAALDRDLHRFAAAMPGEELTILARRGPGFPMRWWRYADSPPSRAVAGAPG